MGWRDGLIDLNDGGLYCKGIKDRIRAKFFSAQPLWIVQTMSDGLAQLDRSLNWIQASPATSDYFNLCGFKDDPFRGTPPQPLPPGGVMLASSTYRIIPSGEFTKNTSVYVWQVPWWQGKNIPLTYWVIRKAWRGIWTKSYAEHGNIRNIRPGHLPLRSIHQVINVQPNIRDGSEMSRVTVSGSNQWKR